MSFEIKNSKKSVVVWEEPFFAGLVNAELVDEVDEHFLHELPVEQPVHFVVLTHLLVHGPCHVFQHRALSPFLVYEFLDIHDQSFKVAAFNHILIRVVETDFTGFGHALLNDSICKQVRDSPFQAFFHGLVGNLVFFGVVLAHRMLFDHQDCK